MRVKIFTFVKDEAQLLRRWVPHHLTITSPENIFIIDHHSGDQDFLNLLRDFQYRGINVVTSTKPFQQKYKVLTKLMHKEKSGADILIPLDSDEFLCIMDEDATICADPEKILEEMEGLPLNGLKYAFNVFEAQPDLTDYDDPLLEMTRFKRFYGQPDASGPNQVTKTFFPSKNFSYTDQGNHEGGVLLAPNDRYNTGPLSMAHYPIRGYSHFLSKLQKAVGAYDLVNKSPEYTGAGMRWNRWYQQTKDLNETGKRMWFRDRFVNPGEGFNDESLAERFRKLDEGAYAE